MFLTPLKLQNYRDEKWNKWLPSFRGAGQRTTQEILADRTVLCLYWCSSYLIQLHRNKYSHIYTHVHKRNTCKTGEIWIKLMEDITFLLCYWLCRYMWLMETGWRYKGSVFLYFLQLHVICNIWKFYISFLYMPVCIYFTYKCMYIYINICICMWKWKVLSLCPALWHPHGL